MEFDELKYAIGFVVIPILVARLLYISYWRKKRKDEFASHKFQKFLFPNNTKWSFLLNNILLILVFTLSILALIDVLSGKEKITITRKTSDVMIVFDLSQSMNANDIAPSRLDKAKKIVEEVIDNAAGDRMGLVIFAGNAYTALPMNNDYEALKTYISNLSTDVMSHQGTNIADALYEAQLSLQLSENTSKAIVIVSDGEEHTGDIDRTIDELVDEEIHVFAVSIGTLSGSPITDYRNGIDVGFVVDDTGSVVVSKREDDVLQEVASKTNGKFFIGNNALNVSESISEELAKLKKNSLEERDSFKANHHFQWFLAPCIFLLIIVSLTNFKSDFNI